MKLVLRILAGIVLLIVILIGGGLTYLNVAFPKARPVTDLVIERTPERVARGEYIVEHVSDCFGCHSDHEWDLWGMPVKAGTKGQGGFVFDANLGVPGVVAAHNITPDPETGIGNWSDDEVLRAIREGISRDGRPLFPMMPFENFHHMSDEDAHSVVAYLRTLEPVRNTVAATKIDFPMNLIMKTIPKPLDGPVSAPADSEDHHAYGEYLVTIAGCGDCHTPRDDKGAPDLTRMYQGGFEMKGPWGRNITPNLTPAPSGYIGIATKEEFIGRFKAFSGMDEADLPKASEGRNTVMPWLALSGMTEEDLGAIYDFLRTLPPVENKVDPFPDATPVKTASE